MFYHSFTHKHNIKNLIIWLSFFAMVVIFLLLLLSDFQPKQKEVTFKIDIKNKVNICLPEEEKSNQN
jgi:hypothetical protein